jgi:hypothetical protein
MERKRIKLRTCENELAELLLKKDAETADKLNNITRGRIVPMA